VVYLKLTLCCFAARLPSAAGASMSVLYVRLRRLTRQLQGGQRFVDHGLSRLGTGGWTAFLICMRSMYPAKSQP
jgi:hypothetical protein